MPESTGPAIIVAALAAALLVYIVAWRLTRGASIAARFIVRGLLPLLLAGPIIVFAWLGGELEPALEKVGGRLSGAPTEETAREQPQEPAGGESAKPEDRVGVDDTGEGPDGSALGSRDKAAEAPPESGPLTIEPPVVTHAPSQPESEAEPTVPASDGRERGPVAAPPAASTLAARSRSLGETEKTDWDIVPVYYGTDRAQEPNDKRLAYGSDRGRRLELGRVLVTVPKTHQVPQIERPWALRIPYFNVTIYEEAEDPTKHFTLQEIKALSRDELVALVRERLAASQRFKDHAFVFVHGYNTSFDNAVYRTAQIAYDLKFDGAPFVYSWPSGGAVASYTYDRESAVAALPYLREFLDLVVKETGAKSVSLIAHSMGNQPLLEVLRDMNAQPPAGVAISQVILAAPDVDADNFTNLARRIEGFAKGVTLYAAANDRALIISRNFWQNPRAGDVPPSGPLIVSGVDTIDVTGMSTDAFALNHSGYAENNDLLQDIGKLILEGLRPPDLRLTKLKRVTTDKGDYWRFVQEP